VIPIKIHKDSSHNLPSSKRLTRAEFNQSVEYFDDETGSDMILETNEKYNIIRKKRNKMAMKDESPSELIIRDESFTDINNRPNHYRNNSEASLNRQGSNTFNNNNNNNKTPRHVGVNRSNSSNSKLTRQNSTNYNNYNHQNNKRQSPSKSTEDLQRQDNQQSKSHNDLSKMFIILSF
jgi:hypothetical protein